MQRTYNIYITDQFTDLCRQVQIHSTDSREAHKIGYFNLCKSYEEVTSIAIDLGDDQIEVYDSNRGFVQMEF